MAKKTDAQLLKGWPFKVKPHQRERVLAMLRAKEDAPPRPRVDHGYGDPNAEFPGDRPEAYSGTMTPELFEEKFTGDMSSIAAITFSNGTQIYGKLKDGFKPAEAYIVNEDGFVVKAAKAE